MVVGKHRGLVPIFIAEAACNIGLSIVLVRAYGVIGTAIGTLIPRLIVSAIIGPWYVCRETGLPLRTFWVGAFIQPTIAIAPFAIASYCIDRFWPATNRVMYFAPVGLLLPVAAIGYWMLCLSGSERDRLGRAFVLARRTAARQS